MHNRRFLQGFVGQAGLKINENKSCNNPPLGYSQGMKTNKSNIRIQNSIKIAERTVAVLKGMNIENAEAVALAEKNLASAKAMLK